MFVREIEMQEGLIESWVETVETYRDLVDADGEPRPMLGPLLVQAALERYPDNAEFEQLRVDVLPDDFPFKGKYDAFEQWLAWGSLLQRTEARFAEHMPVVVHANYHQPKPPRMAAVYDRWHLGQKDALNRFSSEQGFTVPAPTLEADFLHMINDGFVSGANFRDGLAATRKPAGCTPQTSKHKW